MPRAFLVKQRPRASPLRADPDGRGPHDLSVRSKRTERTDAIEQIDAVPQMMCSPCVTEFSPKIVTLSSSISPTLSMPKIDRGSPSPRHLLKPLTSVEPFNRSASPSSRPWQRPIFPTPTYIPFSLPYYSFSRYAAEFYNPSAPCLRGSSLVSPSVMPLSSPRNIGLQLSPHPPPEQHFHEQQHFPLPRQDNAVYHVPWIRKEGSASPIPSSDSSESGRDSISNKHAGVVSSSTGSPNSGQVSRYQCVDCNKSYSTFSGLSRHKQFHCITQAKKSFNCKYCEKVYVSLGALKMHIRTHTLPCKCKICGKAFSRPWLLQGHIRTHTGEKPFSCSQCNRAFADRSNLRAHLQTHSDIKKYHCEACSKTFSRMSLLLKHTDGGCLCMR